MTHSNDLSARIARLEHLLDGLQNGRGAATAGSGDSTVDRGQSALARLLDIAALVQQRATRADCDEGDAIAIRALIEELTSITADLRVLASDLEVRLTEVAGAVGEGHARLKALEDIE